MMRDGALLRALAPLVRAGCPAHEARAAAPPGASKSAAAPPGASKSTAVVQRGARELPAEAYAAALWREQRLG